MLNSLAKEIGGTVVGDTIHVEDGTITCSLTGKVVLTPFKDIPPISLGKVSDGIHLIAANYREI